MNKVEGTVFTMSEYDTLCAAAMNGGIVPWPDLDDVSGEVPAALGDWIKFAERVRMDYALLHLVFAGVIVPTQVDTVDSDGNPDGYRYVKTDMAEVIEENLGVGQL